MRVEKYGIIARKKVAEKRQLKILNSAEGTHAIRKAGFQQFAARERKKPRPVSSTLCYLYDEHEHLFLRSYYHDSDQAMKPLNAKVFNLCKIKNVGIEKWAKEEAGDILDKYCYGTWTL